MPDRYRSVSPIRRSYYRPAYNRGVGALGGLAAGTVIGASVARSNQTQTRPVYSTYDPYRSPVYQYYKY